MKLCFILTLVGVFLTPASGETTHKGGLGGLIDKLKTGNTLNMALESVKILKSFSKVYKEATTFSPLFNDLFAKVGKSNPKYKVDIDLLGGQIPTLMDLYNLIRSRNIHTAFNSVLASDQKFQELVALMTKPDFQNSKDDIERTIVLLTGHKVDLSTAMVLDSSSNKWKVTKARDSKSRNLVEVILLFHDIWNPLTDIFNVATQSKFYLVNLLDAFLKVNYTRLNEISALPTSDEKYTVKGKDGAGIDPEVRQILQLQKTVETNFNNQEYLDALIVQADSNAKLFEIFNRALDQAVSDTPDIVG